MTFPHQQVLARSNWLGIRTAVAAHALTVKHKFGDVGLQKLLIRA